MIKNNKKHAIELSIHVYSEKIKGFIHLFWVVERPCMEGWREETEGEIIVINSHISRITLNINIFDSPMKGYRLNRSRNKIYLVVYKRYTLALNIDTALE